jgi:hypothetical protein
MIDILDNKSIRVPESGFSPDGRWLDRLQLLGSALLQNCHMWLQGINLDGQPGRFEWRPFLWWSGDDQHRKARRGNRCQFQARLRIGEAQHLLAGEQRLVKIDSAVECVRVDEHARVCLQDHHISLHRRRRWRPYILGAENSARPSLVGATAAIPAPINAKVSLRVLGLSHLNNHFTRHHHSPVIQLKGTPSVINSRIGKTAAKNDRRCPAPQNRARLIPPAPSTRSFRMAPVSLVVRR